MRKVILAALICVMGSSAPAEERKVVSVQGAEPGLPFSPGIRVGDVLYLSGAIGNLPGSTETPGGAGEQTRRTLHNLGLVLEAAGMSFADVVSASVYLADSRDFGAMNEVFRSVLGRAPPARTTVEADIAVAAALTEISMVAVDAAVPRTTILPAGWKTPRSPYSWGVLAGDTLYLAGMVSEDPATGRLVGGDIENQTRRALQNAGEVLKAAGMSYRDVVSTRVFLKDAREFEQMNRVYRSFFPEQPPVRATVRARLVMPELKVEIQCIAVRSNLRQSIGERGSRPFSPAVRAGERLWVAGMVGRGPDGFAAGDIREQTRQTLENIRRTLALAGMGFENVVEAVVHLSDIRHYQAMNEVYREIMPSPHPARATTGALLMSPDALVEIMVTAVR